MTPRESATVQLSWLALASGALCGLVCAGWGTPAFAVTDPLTAEVASLERRFRDAGLEGVAAYLQGLGESQLKRVAEQTVTVRPANLASEWGIIVTYPGRRQVEGALWQVSITSRRPQEDYLWEARVSEFYGGRSWDSRPVRTYGKLRASLMHVSRGRLGVTERTIAEVPSALVGAYSLVHFDLAGRRRSVPIPHRLAASTRAYLQRGARE